MNSSIADQDEDSSWNASNKSTGDAPGAPDPTRSQTSEATNASLQNSVLELCHMKGPCGRRLLRIFLTQTPHYRDLNGTAWEAVLFLGWDRVSRVNSVFLAFAYIVNLIIQFLFGVIIQASFPQDMLDRGVITHWRHTIGHSIEQVDSAGRSLVARVCDQDEGLSVARYQMELLTSAKDYQSDIGDWLFGFQVGPTMCVLTLSMWCMLWIVEVMTTLELQFAITGLPRSRHSRLRSGGMSADGQFSAHTFKSISCTRLAMFAVFSTAMRIAVATWLLFQGTLWLIYTPDLTEIVINGVALAFIRDCDELLFQVFVPLSLQSLVLSVEPLCAPLLPKRPTWSALMMGVYMFAMALYVSSNTENMTELISDVCGGRKDFVISQHTSLDLLFTAHTEPVTRALADDNSAGHRFQETARYLVEQEHPSSGAVLLPNLQTLRTIMSSTASDVADIVMTDGCRDMASDDDTQAIFWDSLKRQMEHTGDGTSCADYVANCGSASAALLRLMCPVTCTCFRKSPISAVHEGCAYKTCQEGGLNTIVYNDPSILCVDQSNTALSSSSEWMHFWQSFTEAIESGRFQTFGSAADQSALAQTYSDFALQSGCEVVERFELQHIFCADHPTYQSVASYCPITCGCKDNDYWGCPINCRADW